MNKKGTHVDWVISMGIFVVYVFALFLFLRPGIKPVHKPVTLLNIVEEKFNKEVMWEIKKVPLFVDVCFGSDPDNPARVTINDERDVVNKWNIGKVTDMFDGDIPADSKIGDSLICELVNFRDGAVRNPFYFYFYGGEDAPNFIAECNYVTDDASCVAEVGVAEEIRGIESDALGILEDEDYEVLKERWKDIPIGKEFAIFDDTGIYLVGKKPPAGIDVFVRKLTTQIVKRDGSVIPIGIFLQVW